MGLSPVSALQLAMAVRSMFEEVSFVAALVLKEAVPNA
jgi:hypothetical protein